MDKKIEQSINFIAEIKMYVSTFRMVQMDRIRNKVIVYMMHQL